MTRFSWVGRTLRRSSIVALLFLVVACGGAPPVHVQVPDVVGLCEREAEERLRDVGLEVDVVERVASIEPGGTVIETVPPAGTSRIEGALVYLRVVEGTSPGC